MDAPRIQGAANPYAAVALPQPFNLLGLRLKPFCLGHYFLMARLRLAFVADEPADATLQDLIWGALICSMTYPEFLTFLDSDHYREDIQEWGAKIGMEFNLGEKVQLFNGYLSKAFRQPVVIYEGEVSESGAHWSQVLKCALLGMGYSEDEALALPLSQAFADFYRNAESNGVVSIPTPEVAALLAADDPQQVGAACPT